MTARLIALTTVVFTLDLVVGLALTKDGGAWQQLVGVVLLALGMVLYAISLLWAVMRGDR